MLDLHASESHPDGNEVDVYVNDSHHHEDRHLEEEFSSSPIPTWVGNEERNLLAADEKFVSGLTPNVIVAKDGSDDFTNILAALDALPETYSGRYVIYQEGVYEETVNITNRMANITMYGDGSKMSIITGSKSIAIDTGGDRFMATRLGIRNMAGEEKQQALALWVKSDRSIFFNIRIEGNQDTLFAQGEKDKRERWE
uniref:Pectinesterase n=1 Tax=Oryza brachyantha TaxID=4533 RepID=J3LES3_ORYBR